LHADRYEIVNGVVRLYQGAGVSEIPEQAIASFEHIDDPVSSPPLASRPEPVAVPAVAAEVPVSNDPRELIRLAAIREGLPPEFVASVARAESAFRQDAISPKGAIGVMQLMPGTAKELGANPYDVKQNIDAGTRLLRDLLVKYDGDVIKALSAYNAGPGAVARYQGLPPFDETRRYVNKVIGLYQQATASVARPTTASSAAAQEGRVTGGIQQ
jgi:soluble lytic murein transglycosylase-like protein